MTEVSREMLAAYVAWEPPCEVDVTKPARALGLIRAAFFAGWSAASRIEAATADETAQQAQPVGQEPAQTPKLPHNPPPTPNIEGA